MASEPKTHPIQRLNFGRLLLGRPLETKELPHQAISKPIGLAVFASDALSSTAYATQEMLIILAIAGSGAAVLGISIPLAIAISILLTIVTISYRQTIHAYPNGGGAYIVARDNLGELPAQIAGAALLTDYILTVAVSISAGVEQITSGFRGLIPYRIEIAVGVIIVMTLINLRGVKESGRIFAVPTYFFLALMFLTLGIGFVRYFSGTLGTVKDVERMHYDVVKPLTLFLILRAFSSGCAALTGIEAISNGVTAFKEPRSRNAAITLVWMSSILITLFLGITFLAHQIGAQPSEVETIISQLGRTIFGDGILWYMVLAGTALILLMAANTSYADFPRLAALHAGDGFLPRQLTYRGSRLVFSWGIMILAITSSLLVVVAQANTTRLIPLYAVGVFLGFTISQTGMVVRLRKSSKLQPGEKIQTHETVLTYDPQWRLKIVISSVGAFSTFVVMMIFAITKFMSGAWFVVLLIPCLVYIFFRIHYHYKDVAHYLSLGGARPELDKRPVVTLILVDDVHAETARMVNFAKSLDHPWQAIHIGINPEKAEVVKQKWHDRIGEGELVIIPSPYRLLAEPIREYIEHLQQEVPRCFVHVIMGHLVMDTFWEQALHQNSAFIFNLALGRMKQVVVTSVPYQIRRKNDSLDEVESEAESPTDAFASSLTESVQPT
ncbi:MAG: APC family permease [Anaerolineales bacterium]|nr:APC family permease [Anaerolineales bacterium]